MAKKKSAAKGGPQKQCPQCGASAHARTKVCAKCGAPFPPKETASKPVTAARRSRGFTGSPTLADALVFVRECGGVQKAVEALVTAKLAMDFVEKSGGNVDETIELLKKLEELG